MDLMITLSLLLNIAVLVPVCGGLLANAKWAVDVYGDATPARGILLSVYIAIGSISLLLLVLHDPKSTAALLLVQAIYKVLTPLTVGSLTNPVVISNLCIAAFHAVTLFLICNGTLAKLAS
jgi:hypothetical protein